MKAQKQSSFHVCSPFSASTLPPLHHNGKWSIVTDSTIPTVFLFPQVTRASTLPRNVVHGRDRASSEGVPGEGDGVGKGANEEELPALPERRYSTSELGLEDEAPPLPPRRYSWSDVEDNDEEVS